MDHEMPDAVISFIERFGMLTEEEGTPRTAGRIFALLLVAEAAVSFSDIASRLQVSRSGVSTNLRLLEEMGMAERVGRAGARQDYFQIPDLVWYRMIERKIARETKAQEIIEDLLDGMPDLHPKAYMRLNGVTELLERSKSHARETIRMIIEKEK